MKNNKIMKIMCIDDRVSTKSLTKGKVYDVISLEKCAGDLYKIVDDDGNIKRYSIDFFKIITQ